MKLLLVAVNAKYIHSNPAVYSLKAYASQYHDHIKIAEYTINNRREEILADLYQRCPDLIAFSCYIWNWDLIQGLFADIKKLLPNVIIWLGGPEVSFLPEEILRQHVEVQGIMLGEGEETFLELTHYYIDKTCKIEEIAGIITREGRTSPRKLLDMAKIPFLYHEPKVFENRIIYYESSRGCPFRCSYCLSSIDKTVRLRDYELVKQELKYLLDKKVKQVKFVDRTFNCNHDHTIRIWEFLIKNDNGITNFHFEVSADILQDDELKILSHMRPGLVQLEIGVQSTNPNTLKEIDRYADFETLKAAVSKIQSTNNIHIHLDLIAGLPYEDFASFKKSFDEVYQMRPHQLQLGFLKILKGSKMHQKVNDYGITYSSHPPYEVFRTKWLDYDAILTLKRIEEMVEIYYNSNQFITTLKLLQTCFSSAFTMYYELSRFYVEHEYHIKTPSRVARYEVLLQFASTIDSQYANLYAEALTFDCYLRENMKSRPVFSYQLDALKEEFREIKKHRNITGKEKHLEPFYYPVWIDSNQVKMKKEKPWIICFDYTKRNPLTYEAFYEEISYS